MRRRSLKTLPTNREPLNTQVRDATPRGARSTTGNRLRSTAHPSTVTHLGEAGGRLRRWRRRMRAAIPFSAEQQFRLLQAALKIQLRSEGKPEDALTLRRPDDLPPPPGTPVRRPSRPVTLNTIPGSGRPGDRRSTRS
jgi:hypothetical protein